MFLLLHKQKKLIGALWAIILAILRFKEKKCSTLRLEKYDRVSLILSYSF